MVRQLGPEGREVSIHLQETRRLDRQSEHESDDPDLRLGLAVSPPQVDHLIDFGT